jgi:hypothetical protein
MKTKALVIIFITVVLVSCAPASTPAPTNLPQPTSTFTPQPTATPAPVEVSGLLFLDANGNGLKDEASFICPDVKATPASLEHFFSKTCSSENAGQLVAVSEPPLANFTVCKENICTETDTNGKYTLSLTGAKNGEKIALAIKDPNSDNPVFAIKYINVLNKVMVIPAYEMNGAQVPEQHLSDTKITPIQNGFSTIVGTENQTGLTQGYIIFPLSAKDYEKLEMIQGFDHDISPAVVDFLGSTSKCLEYNVCQSMSRKPGQILNGVGNDHTGIDYGYYGSPDKYNMLIYAAMAGYIQERPTDGGKQKNNIDILTFSGQNFGTSPKPLLNNGHTATYLVDDGVYVYSGQIIAIMGNTGTANPHLHFEIQYGKRVNNEWIGYSKDFYAQTVPDLVVSGFNDISVWTVYNLPIFSTSSFQE